MKGIKVVVLRPDCIEQVTALNHVLTRCMDNSEVRVFVIGGARYQCQFKNFSALPDMSFYEAYNVIGKSEKNECMMIDLWCENLYQSFRSDTVVANETNVTTYYQTIVRQFPLFTRWYRLGYIYEKMPFVKCNVIKTGAPHNMQVWFSNSKTTDDGYYLALSDSKKARESVVQHSILANYARTIALIRIDYHTLLGRFGLEKPSYLRVIPMVPQFLKHNMDDLEAPFDAGEKVRTINDMYRIKRGKVIDKKGTQKKKEEYVEKHVVPPRRTFGDPRGRDPPKKEKEEEEEEVENSFIESEGDESSGALEDRRYARKVAGEEPYYPEQETPSKPKGKASEKKNSETGKKKNY